MGIDWTAKERGLVEQGIVEHPVENGRDTIVGWVDQRIAHMLAAPRMWGSDEAVEMQVLLLLELRAFALRPSQELDNPSRILDTYTAYLAERFPKNPQRPLFQLVTPDELGFALAAELRQFLDVFVPSMHERHLVEVIGSSTTAEPLDRHDEIRGIDLDRGFIILGKRERLPCYVRAELLGSVALVGVQAHVRGQLYRPLIGRSFGLVESIEFSEPPEGI